MILFKLTELYDEPWSWSWSRGVWIGDGKWTLVKSGNEPVLFPIGIWIVPGSGAEWYILELIENTWNFNVFS